MECVANPFGKNADGSYTIGAHQGRVMDGATPMSRSMVCTYSEIITLDDQGIVIKMHSPRYVGNSLDLGYEYATAAAGVGTPTASVVRSCPQWDADRNNIYKARMVGGGLKVIAVSSADDTAGMIRGGSTHNQIRTAVATWDTFTAHENQYDDNLYALNDGLTVRWGPMDNEDYQFVSLYTNAGMDVWDQTLGHTPSIVIGGGKTNTKIQIAVVFHLEVIDIVNTSPGMSRSPVSMRWMLLQALVSDPHLAPVVVKGHSFSSFLTGAGNVVKKVADATLKYVLPVAGMLTAGLYVGDKAYRGYVQRLPTFPYMRARDGPGNEIVYED